LLIFKVDGAKVDVSCCANVQAASKSIDFIGIGGGGEGTSEIEASKSGEGFGIGINAAMVKHITWADKVGVFSDVTRSDEADIVDITFDADVPGEIKGSIHAETFDGSRTVVGGCDRYAAS
jgi:hypothetical protein